MLDVLIYGLLRGATFALVAFGFSLVLGVLNIVNITHGIFIIFGGLITYTLFSELGWPLPLAVVTASLATGALAGVLQKAFIERVHSANPLMVLVQTLGLAIVITSIFEKTWGTSERLINAIIPGYPIIQVGDFIVPTLEVVTFVIALASAGVLYLAMERTEFGRTVRACRDNPRSAALLGIDISGVYLKTMIVCGLWTGLAGALLITTQPLAPYMHLHWTIEAFLIVIIGGLGSMPGVLVGGLLYGIFNHLAYFYYPAFAPALIFSGLVVLLLVRPQGVFGLGAVIRK
ncbi:branched-chain amino acid ABC transporter permease [Vineibacter terrae]|uniref:Branched-chain amino acid ABC transporter permease n=1 Tax=Vineibacter terrae TaxID=2586908 RepID=A0A5C8P8N1_9HYPH|nr:branched-chain amino acid ABC transporter permease [Vineibacter terrae]TXL69711.1 branched-chain amino acid ABC transporter permease [Vineibacter terrae]